MKKERGMGNKHIVPYALYMAKGYISPAFAELTRFTTDDMDLLIKALMYMFEHDRSAARGEMVVRGLYDFEHVGTQPEANADQNQREARLAVLRRINCSKPFRCNCRRGSFSHLV